MKIARQKRFWIFAGLNGLLISLGFLYVFFQPTKRSFRKLATERALLKQLDEARYVEGSIAPSAATTNVRCNERDNDHVVRAEDKASKDFREARANGRVLSSQVVKEFT